MEEISLLKVIGGALIVTAVIVGGCIILGLSRRIRRIRAGRSLSLEDREPFPKWV